MQRTGIIVVAALVIGAIALAVAASAPPDAGRDRLYQVSTIDALLQRVYDGSVTRAPPDETTPFAAVTRFRPDRTGALGPAGNLTVAQQRLSTFLTSTNLFAMVRADGTFDYVKVRAPRPQSKPYPDLVDATADQGVHEFRNASGTLVGTYTPPYVEGVAITGWHLHFISDDRSFGGHVLEIASDGTPRVGIDDLTSFTVVLPVGTDFTETDLSQNLSSDLRVVEKGT